MYYDRDAKKKRKKNEIEVWHPSGVQFWRVGNSILKQDPGDGIKLTPPSFVLSFFLHFHLSPFTTLHDRSSVAICLVDSLVFFVQASLTLPLLKIQFNSLTVKSFQIRFAGIDQLPRPWIEFVQNILKS